MPTPRDLWSVVRMYLDGDRDRATDERRPAPADDDTLTPRAGAPSRVGYDVSGRPTLGSLARKSPSNRTAADRSTRAAPIEVPLPDDEAINSAAPRGFVAERIPGGLLVRQVGADPRFDGESRVRPVPGMLTVVTRGGLQTAAHTAEAVRETLTTLY